MAKKLNPLGTIVERKVVRFGRKTTAFDARKRYTGPDGRRKEKSKRCWSRSEANTALLNFANEIRQEFIDYEANKEKPKNHTFAELAAYYRKNYVKKAVFRDGRKISGFKDNLKNITKKLNTLEEHFGEMPLRSITYEDIRIFAEEFQRKKNSRNKYPAQSTVNNLLSVLRRVLNVGIQKDWLDVNPFRRGDPLINKRDAGARKRVLSFEEEERLLAACTGEKEVLVEPKDRKPYKALLPVKREHLIPLIICALDTAMRRGEIFKLKRKQIDLENRVIYLLGADAADTKTGAEGILPMTDRLYEILVKKCERLRPEQRVFPRLDFKNAFRGACEDAGIEDLQFRDLRATAISRMLESGVVGDIVRKVSRHSKETEVFHTNYVRVGVQTAQMIGNNLNALLNSKMSSDDKKTITKAA